MPGPLFTFSAYLGTVMAPSPNGWSARRPLPCRDLPARVPARDRRASVLERVPAADWAQSALRGINAAVVGLLLAALYGPVWTSAVLGPPDFALALVAFVLLAVWRAPPWLVVALTAAAGAALGVGGMERT